MSRFPPTGGYHPLIIYKNAGTEYNTDNVYNKWEGYMTDSKKIKEILFSLSADLCVRKCGNRKRRREYVDMHKMRAQF